MNFKNNNTSNNNIVKLKKIGFSILVMIFFCFSCQKKATESTDKITNSVAMNSQEHTKQNLIVSIDNYIENKVNQSIENETQYFSLAPFKMFYRTVFFSREERTNAWIENFNANGLSKVDLENFINNQQKVSNDKTNSFVQNIQLKAIKKQEIITDEAYDALTKMEFEVWSQNIWFDSLLAASFMLIIACLLSVFMSIEVSNILLTLGAKLIVGIIIILVFFFTYNEIRKEASVLVTSNYVEYINNQIEQSK